jgi:acetate---CoA ligase (ADP-forming)
MSILMSPSRSLYRRADLQRALNPDSIAIIGASPRAGSFGERSLQNLSRYDGRIYLINAKYQQIDERPCYASLRDLPEVPDSVVITVPREAVEEVIAECAELGVGGAIIFASGYAETAKEERVQEQARLTEIARKSGLKIFGPNCIGWVNYLRGALVSFLPYPRLDAPRELSIGLVSQSGALAQSLAQAIEHGTSFSHVFTSGNSCDVDVADLVAYLADEPSCKAIACVFEGLADPQRMIAAAELCWQRNKPLLINKLATGEQGAAAAMSHTGSLAGSEAAYRAMFERAGAIVVDNFEALIETTVFFAKAPPPTANGVAVIATSGGAAIMAADKAEIYDVPLPQPSDEVRKVLESFIPDFGSARNPCDVTAQVINNLQSLATCGDAMLGDPRFGAVVVPQPFAYDTATPRIKIFSDIAQRHGKIACNVWLSEWLEGPGADVCENDRYVAMFRSMERCFAALKAWHWVADKRRAQQQSSERDTNARYAAPSATAQGAALIAATTNTTLTEREAKTVLASYGVPVVGESLVNSADEAVAAAQQLGLPVVLKVESADLPHKTEAGVIRLNLHDELAVRNAYAEVMANANKVTPTPRINGVLVQPMVPSGVEIMVGARIDPLFGPLLVVGLGGIFVELLKDSVIALAPVDRNEALAMLQRLKGAAILRGFRGAEPVDMEKLAEVICRISELVADQRGVIAELDVNPLVCSGGRIVAVDALIVKSA